MMRSAVAGLVAAGALALAPSAGAISFQQEGSPYTVGANPYGVLAGNFDGFGGPDFATVNGTSSNLSVFLRQGGGFIQETGSPFAVGTGPNYAASADFNGDTLPDIAVANFVSSNVTILLRQAGGGFVQESPGPVAGPRERDRLSRLRRRCQAGPSHRAVGRRGRRSRVSQLNRWFYGS